MFSPIRNQQEDQVFGYMIYRDGTVGLTFEPMPNLSYNELSDLIAKLHEVQAEMAARRQTKETNHE